MFFHRMPNTFENSWSAPNRLAVIRHTILALVGINGYFSRCINRENFTLLFFEVESARRIEI
ncbi:hypothetical protein WH47_05692 [Habropoda laboriosa]|uniref:Uncharacterized protein n=1 Tax=Habropoda laboriosa TaxID=597456 RepID=A0A0L7QQS8_9HYME|nr:hypothetical protein WH47_05692 [Habropoda laboriosa]